MTTWAFLYITGGVMDTAQGDTAVGAALVELLAPSKFLLAVGNGGVFLPLQNPWGADA